MNATDSSAKIAEYLLKIKAVKLQPDQPFTWASGWKSPIYCDNRKTLSYPEIRTYIRDQFIASIQNNFSSSDVIAGVATGGIALGALVAQEMNLPFVYIRSEAKKHGLTNMIEGEISSRQRVVVIEDLISTGGSSLKAVEALREKGCIVTGLIAIFSYGFPMSEVNFHVASCDFFTLSNYEVLIEEAVRGGYVNESNLETLKQWRKNPE